jgi:phosphoglycerate dehydrogenase-like enzyme
MRRHALSLLVFCCVLPAQTKKVIANLPPDMVKELAVSAPNVKIVAVRGPELAKEIEDADAVVGVTLTPELFKHARQLKWLHISSAGVESHGRQVDVFPELAASNVVVNNAKNVYGPQIADHAFAFLLALTRKLNVSIPRQQLEEWPTSRDGMFELNGKTAVPSGWEASAARSRSAPMGSA